jgi:hypothetical protein
LRNFARLWSRFSEWFNRVFSKADRPGANRDSGASSPLPTRILIALFSLTFLAAGAWLLIKRLRAVAAPVASMPSAAPKLPDAAREDAKADDFPEEEWLSLMERLRAEGQHRLALRALFLAMLSLLARKGWVTVAQHKSNRDYQREVAARARRRPGVAESFQENCGRFERIWYGSHALTEEDWTVSQSNFAKIRVEHA